MSESCIVATKLAQEKRVSTYGAKRRIRKDARVPPKGGAAIENRSVAGFGHGDRAMSSGLWLNSLLYLTN